MPFDLFAIALEDDPYPSFRALREQAPVHDTGVGYWYVSRYDDVNRLLRDPGLVSGTGVADSLGLTEGPLFDIMTVWMMSLDGAAHTRVRKAISGVFTPRAVESLRPAIEALTDDLLDDLARADGPVDVIGGLAFPVPMQVVRMLFGIAPDEWQERVTVLFDPAAGVSDPALGPLGPMAPLGAYLGEVVARRRSEPGSDMFSALVTSGAGTPDALGDAELVANGVLLVTAGFETTMSFIGNAVLCMAAHPAQAAWVRGDATRVRDALEEVLRYETPALSTSRRTTVDTPVGDAVIPAGADILFSVAAAHRDPDRYDDPDRFDVTRTDVRPLSFGAGLHACIGASLSRLEAEVVIGRLIDRFPALALATDTVAWRKDNPTVRGPKELPVTL